MLVDLDELLLRCRDERARAYASEAVSCYRSGAYRAAIITTWIAVAFDIIDKVRELALTGDKAAEEIYGRFESITKGNDLSQALQFERELLTLAKDRLELISAQEFADLERLQQDRHRCAHPSRTAMGEVFSPSAELARLHIRSAIEHLLQHEPAQGKTALDSVLALIDSEYFPFNAEKALGMLSRSPLRRARASLVRNLCVVLLKALIKDGNDPTRSIRRERALLAVREMHREVWLKTVREVLSPLTRSLSLPNELMKAVRVAYMHSELYEAMEEDQRLRLEEVVFRLPSHDIEFIESLLDGPFASAARSRVERMTEAELDEVASVTFDLLHPAICDQIVHRYSRVESFDEANTWAKRVQGNLRAFSVDQLKKILQSSLENSQIAGSFQLRHTVSVIKKLKGADPELAPLIGVIEARGKP